MKRFRFFLMAFMLMISATIMAQNTTVRGVVFDKNLGEGEAFATIRVYKQQGTDTTAVAMFVTDADGVFSKEIAGNGNHRMVVSSVGKENLTMEIALGNSAELNLDTLFMKEDAHTLKSVEVVAQKPLVKMEVDKMSYRVEDDNDAKSSTVLDMLRKVPMVSVDGQDNISVNGSSSFKVYVDGKPNAMFNANPSMIFKSMPASMVKSIEVVTNPGAKYDAEGATGVLNIVMNKQQMTAGSMNGINGTIRAAAGTNALGAGAFISGQQDKLSYSANMIYNYMKPGTTEVDVVQQNGVTDINTIAKTKTRLPLTMGNVTLGYEIDANSSINTALSLTNMIMRNKGSYTTKMLGNGFNDGFGYESKMNMENRQTSFTWNLDYQRFFNTEHTKSITLTYQLNHDPSKTEQSNDFNTGSSNGIDLTDRVSVSDNKTTEHTFQVDYTTPIAEGQNINMGAKMMTRKASTDSKYYLNDVVNEGMGMDYLYKNTILAGYSEYEAKWGNVGAKAGLRYEHTWQDVEYRKGQGENFSKNYGSLVPAASFSYSLAPTKNIGLTYNMRISRPGISYLNPYIDRSDPNSLTYGNTDLDVEKSHNVSLVYNMYSPKLMLNVSLRNNYTGNAIEQYSFYNNGLLNNTYGNVVQRNLTGLNAYANWMVTKNTRLFLNGGVSYIDLRSDKLDYSNSGWQSNVMAGLQQTLPWDLKIGAYLISSSKSYTLQGWSSGFNMVTANLSKTFFNDKLTIGIQGMTGLSGGGNIKMETYSKGKDFSSHQTIKVPLGGINLTVSYTFGKAKQFKQHVSKVQNDYIEQQSQGEMLNSIGGGSGSGTGGANGGGAIGM